MSASIKWPIVRLETLAQSKKNAIVGGPFGSNLVSADYVEEGVPVVRGVNLPKDASFSCDRLVFVSESKADSLKQNLATPGDLIFTQRGTLGQVGIAPHGTPYDRFLISQSQMKMSVDQGKCDPRYLYYFFRMSSTVDYIHNHALQSGVPHINLGILRRFEVVCPPVDVQRTIAGVLTAYDDLIENNKRRITLLENMAEEIYREWFVRFRFPGWQEAEFEKGYPASWRALKFDEFCKLKRGYDLPDSKVRDGPYPVLASTSVKTFHNEYKVKAPVITTGRSGSLGTVLFKRENCWPLNTTLYVQDFKGNSPFFVYFTLKNMPLETFNSGAGVPSLNRNHLAGLRVVVPDETAQKAFDNIVEPIFRQVDTFQEQSEQLQKTKNQLLPRLISGKLSVDDLDIQFPPSMQSGESDSADEVAA
jgi:type I restriction enzyme S subunit